MKESQLNLNNPDNLRAYIAELQSKPAFDGLSPIKDPDLTQVSNFSQFLDTGQENSANQFRALGEAKLIWKEMLADDKNVIYLGLSGDMVSAGLAPTISEMVKRRYVDVVFSQGANFFHDMARTMGFERFKTKPQEYADTDLFKKGMVRMFDILEDADAQKVSVPFIASAAKKMEEQGFEIVSTRQFYNFLGEKLINWDLVKKEGIITTCYRENVPIFIAGCESSVTAMDLASAQNLAGINLEIGIGKELRDHALLQQELESQGMRTNLIEIGGGVVRNTLQQTATGSYITQGNPFDTKEPEWFKRHLNAILITTDTGMPYGGASSVPLSEHNPKTEHPQGENLSWGKFDPEGKRTTVYMDATVAIPLLVKGLMDDPKINDIIENRKPVQFSDLLEFPLKIKTA